MNNRSAKWLRRTARTDLAAFYMQQAVDERIRTLAERILKAQTSTEVGNLVAQLRWVGHAALEEWRCGGERCGGAQTRIVSQLPAVERIREVADKLIGYRAVYKNDGEHWNGNAPSGYKLANYGEALLEALDTQPTVSLPVAAEVANANFARVETALAAEVTRDAGDAVNHPKHYTFGTIEVITVILDWGLDFLAGNVVKYVARAKHKGNEVQDLEKARWYLDKLIETVKGATA